MFLIGLCHKWLDLLALEFTTNGMMQPVIKSLLTQHSVLEFILAAVYIKIFLVCIAEKYLLCVNMLWCVCLCSADGHLICICE